MKIKTISHEELETMSFDDIAYIILKEKGKKMKISEIFQIICEELNLGEKAYEEQIADFFTLLATEKRFIQLDKGYWDLRENHKTEVELDEIEDEEIEEDEETEEKDTEEDDMYLDETKDTDDDEADDDLQDLVIMDEENEQDL